jgi:hypothetical protein
MRANILCGALALAALTSALQPVMAQQRNAPVQTVAISEPRQHVERFFAVLQPNGAQSALEHLFGAGLSTMAAEELINVRGQLQAARAMGPSISNEMVEDRRLGQAAAQLRYVTRHSNEVVLWTFTFVRDGDGWRVTNLNFTDDSDNFFSR